jgi:hypothetical protein
MTPHQTTIDLIDCVNKFTKMGEIMDFPIAKSSLQTKNLVPWANLYITQHSQIST